MEKSTEEYRNYWDEKVQQDGDYPEYLSPGGNHHLFKAFTPIIQHLPKNKKVLDIGCGSGFSTYFYYPFCTQLVGVDYSAEAIKKATEKYPHITFVQSDVTALPFKDREFDVIICQGVLHHLIKSTNRLSSNLVYNSIQEIDRVGKGLILVDEANALNPLRRYKERIYYPTIHRNEQSYMFRTWKKIFHEFGYSITHLEYHTFIPTSFSQKMITIAKPLEGILESFPIINKLAGGIFFVCEKNK